MCVSRWVCFLILDEVSWRIGEVIGVRGIVLFLNEYRMYVLLTKTLNSDSVNSDFFHIGQRV
jgi:hypothetical protein